MPLCMKTKLLIGLMAAVYLFAYIQFDFWKSALYGGDSWGYYIHLPSTFLFQDVGDYTKSGAARLSHEPKGKDPYLELHVSPIGKRVVKYPVGVAILEAPFFALAHIYCLATGAVADGFSSPYLFIVGLSTMFYALWGIWLLLLALRPYFQDERILLLTGLIIGLGTNLFYSSTYTVGMSHPYLFFLYALLLLSTVRFYADPTRKAAGWVGASAGFIALTRSPEVICVLIPLLWGIQTWRDVPARFYFFRTHFSKLAIAALAFILAILPQAIYWKFISGQWWYYGYKGEKFDWKHPRILDGLFHFQNGWLIYTPVMALALLGLFQLRKRAADALWPILVFLPLHWYIIYSWWCWNYINGFGSRPMIEVLALLAFPLAAFCSAMWSKNWTKVLLGFLTAFFICLNLFQTWQVSRGLLLSESLNRAYYAAIFGRTTSDDAAAIAFTSNELQPDLYRSGWQTLLHGSHDTLLFVRQLAFNGMEDSSSVSFTRELKRNGSFGFRCEGEFSPECYLEAADSLGIRPGDYLKVSVANFMKGNEMVYEQDKLAALTVHMFDPGGKTIKYSKVAVSARTQNTQGSIWYTGIPGVWGEASFFVRVPKKFKNPDRIKVYVWNPSGQRLYLDDLKVELWRYH